MYYSQHGEDFILDQIFNDKKDGFYVEVGCIDGRRFSNTLFFEEKGWQGINIEAHPDYIDILRTNRPHSEVVYAAVSDRERESVTFYTNRRGSLSTLDKQQEKKAFRDHGKYFEGFSETKVPMRTLTSIFEELSVSEIDILSLDIEGGEKDALNGLDFNKYKPKVLVIEFGSISDLWNLKKMLKPHGYFLNLILKNNLFFTTDCNLFSDLNSFYTDIYLLHTGNKIDNEEDKEHSVDIDISKLAQYKQMYKVLIHNLKHKVKDVLSIYD